MSVRARHVEPAPEPQERIEIRPGTLVDVAYVATNMRPQDREEIEAVFPWQRFRDRRRDDGILARAMLDSVP